MGTFLLDNFRNQSEQELLKILIAVYRDSLNLSEEEQVDRLVEKLKETFEERTNENQTA